MAARKFNILSYMSQIVETIIPLLPEGFNGTMDDIDDGVTYVKTENNMTDELKSEYDGAAIHAGTSHAPADAQKNSDIIQAEIEAKLMGEINSHTHAGGGLTQQQIEGFI